MYRHKCEKSAISKDFMHEIKGHASTFLRIQYRIAEYCFANGTTSISDLLIENIVFYFPNEFGIRFKSVCVCVCMQFVHW